MNKTLNKAISALLIFAMAIPFASCSMTGLGSGNNKGTKITEDSPWYNSQVIKVKAPADKDKKVLNSQTELAGIDDKNIIVYTFGRYEMPDKIPNTEDTGKYVIASISVIDKTTGEIKKTIDMSADFNMLDSIIGAALKDGKVTLRISAYDNKTYMIRNIEKDIDLETGKTTDVRDISGGSGQSTETSYKLGEYTVDAAAQWKDGTGYYILSVNSPDGNSEKVEVKETNNNINEIPNILAINDTTALVPANTQKGFMFYELDLKTPAIKALDPKDYAWLNVNELKNAFTGSDGKAYITTSTGLFKIDIDNSKTDKVLDYSWCAVNRTFLEPLELVESDGNMFLFCGQRYKISGYVEDSMAADFYIVRLDKASKNPHAGKTILNLYAPDGQTDETTSDAIIKFNETNKDYFVEVTNKYNTDNSEDLSKVNSNDEHEKASLTADAKMCDRLAVDILNGEGPDILIDTSRFGQLNSENYLVDLSGSFNNLDRDKYFTNLVEASKIDGKLYQMPVNFLVKGIHTDRKYAGSSGIGFTVDEYEKFLNGTLNAQDVITYGQAMYFAKVFNSMNDKFIRNGKADFSGPEFAQLADFVKNNVPEKSKSWDDEDYGKENPNAVFSDCFGFTGYFYNISHMNGDITILGMPSCDGRGPMFEAYTSVAVSAQAVDKKACIEFVKFLLSDEVQEEYAMNDNLVLNREAFRKGGMTAAEFYNSPAGDTVFGYDNENGQKKSNRIKFSEKNIDDLENIVLTCSKASSEDQAVSIILIEEMPAYFSGQKDLESVIKIAQDRVQKVLNERR